MKNLNLDNRLFGYVIRVFSGEYPNSDQIIFLKWKWCFEYRTALLRVQYPKNCIQSFQFDVPGNKKSRLELLQKKLSSQKGKVTKYNNLLKKAEKNWSLLFPIEDDVEYQKALKKVKEAEYDLLKLEFEISNLKNK